MAPRERHCLLAFSCVLASLFLAIEENRIRTARSVFELPTHVVTSAPVVFMCPLPSYRQALAVVHGGDPSVVLLYDSGPASRPRIVPALPPETGPVLAGAVDSTRRLVFLVTRRLGLLVISLDSLRVLLKQSIPLSSQEGLQALSASLSITSEGVVLVAATLSNHAVVVHTTPLFGSRPPASRVQLLEPKHEHSSDDSSRTHVSSLQHLATSLHALRQSAFRAGCTDVFPNTASLDPRAGPFLSSKIPANGRPHKIDSSAQCIASVAYPLISVFKWPSLVPVAPTVRAINLPAPWAFRAVLASTGKGVALAVYSSRKNDRGQVEMVGADTLGKEYAIALPSFLSASSIVFFTEGDQLHAVVGGTDRRGNGGVVACLELVNIEKHHLRWTRRVAEPVRALHVVEADMGRAQEAWSPHVVVVARQHLFAISSDKGQLVGSLVHDEDDLLNGGRESQLRHMFGTPRVGRPTNVSTISDGVLWIGMEGGENVALGVDVAEVFRREWPLDLISLTTVLVSIIFVLMKDVSAAQSRPQQENEPAASTFCSSRSRTLPQPGPVGGLGTRHRRNYRKEDI